MNNLLKSLFIPVFITSFIYILFLCWNKNIWKSDLRLRLIYHQKERRVEAHIFISALAYHVLHAIEYALRQRGDTRSWNTIKQVLQTHQVITVVLPDEEGSLVHHVRVATEAEADQGEIYKKLGVDPNVIKRKRVTSKKAEL